jgi:hypothetical protein
MTYQHWGQYPWRSLQWGQHPLSSGYPSNNQYAQRSQSWHRSNTFQSRWGQTQGGYYWKKTRKPSPSHLPLMIHHMTVRLLYKGLKQRLEFVDHRLFNEICRECQVKSQNSLKVRSCESWTKIESMYHCLENTLSNDDYVFSHWGRSLIEDAITLYGSMREESRKGLDWVAFDAANVILQRDRLTATAEQSTLFDDTWVAPADSHVSVSSNESSDDESTSGIFARNAGHLDSASSEAHIEIQELSHIVSEDVNIQLSSISLKHFTDCCEEAHVVLYTMTFGCNCIERGNQIILRAMYRQLQGGTDWCLRDLDVANGIPFHRNYLVKLGPSTTFKGRILANTRKGRAALVNFHPRLSLAATASSGSLRDYITRSLDKFWRARKLDSFMEETYDEEWCPRSSTIKYIFKEHARADYNMDEKVAYIHGSDMFTLASIAVNGFNSSCVGQASKQQWGSRVLQEFSSNPHAGIYTLKLESDPPVDPCWTYCMWTDIFGDRYYWRVYYVLYAYPHSSIKHTGGKGQYIFKEDQIWMKEIRITAAVMSELKSSSPVSPVWIPQLETPWN